MGGSYGGYLTSWAIGHTARFAAAVSERAVNNLATLETASDFAGAFRQIIGASHLDTPMYLILQMRPASYSRTFTAESSPCSNAAAVRVSVTRTLTHLPLTAA